MTIEAPRKVRLPNEKPALRRTVAHLLLDMTGSMEERKRMTLDAYNEYIRGLKASKLTRDFVLSVSVFNSEIAVRTLIEAQPAKFAPELDEGSYVPAATTPLYDSIAYVLKDVASKMNDGDAALIIIQTDGLENASGTYKKEQVAEMIRQRQDEGWQFVYLGCGIDAMAEGGEIGIPVGSTVSYVGATTPDMMRSLASATKRYAAMSSTATPDFMQGKTDFTKPRKRTR